MERVDTHSLRLFLDEGIIPIVPPIGFDGEGKTFRVNSDSIAFEVAEALRATKIIYLMAGDGLCVHGEVVRQLLQTGRAENGGGHAPGSRWRDRPRAGHVTGTATMVACPLPPPPHLHQHFFVAAEQ